MDPVTSFVIPEFTNPSGEIVYRVSGWLDGKRIRKNFTTRSEALAERQVLEVRRLQAETGIRPTVTRLTEAQLHEAEAAFHRLAGNSETIIRKHYLNLKSTAEAEQFWGILPQGPTAAVVTPFVAPPGSAPGPAQPARSRPRELTRKEGYGYATKLHHRQPTDRGAGAGLTAPLRPPDAAPAYRQRGVHFSRGTYPKDQTARTAPVTHTVGQVNGNRCFHFPCGNRPTGWVRTIECVSNPPFPSSGC